MEEIGDDATVSAPAPAPALRLKWDVFLSFRGEDTRDSITDHLYAALYSAGVRVFRDNDGLNEGDEIAAALVEAIEDSAAAIVILSPNYASSRWCLEELARVCELRRPVLPVFYRVDPSDVRRQRGPFEEGFRRHEGRFGVENVERWRKAMERVGGTKGWVFHDRICDSEEQELIELLVKKVLREVSNSPMAVTPFLVGHDFRMKEIMEILDVKGNGIRVLVLHGIGGVGKTTLSKALYNKLAKDFQHRIFIENVRETASKHGGVLLLQEKLVNHLSQGKLSIDDLTAGVAEIKRRLRGKRVFLILDDVDDMNLLNSLAGDREWFFEGSRVIITTRNKQILQSEIVSESYELRELGSSDSLTLFSHHAFRREMPPSSGPFLALSKQIVSITGGLPLALQVFGSFLCDKRRVDEWKDSVEKLKQIGLDPLQNVLKVSYDGLDDEEKCIFLDVACLFLDLDMKKGEVIDVVKGCGFRGEVALKTLATRSLIKVVENDKLWMHDSIRDMGRQVVVQQGLLDQGKRSRLWDHDDVLSVLQDRKGTREVEGIILDLEKKKKISKIISAKRIASTQLQTTPNFTYALTYLREVFKQQGFLRNDSNNVIVRSESFDPMVNLRLLQFSDVKVEGNVGKLPNSLRWLQWRNCPLKTFPSNFYPRELAVLDLSESPVLSVGNWKWSWNSRKETNRLKVMNLRGCYNITALPDLSAHKALEKLTLELCTSLKSIHQSIGDLKALRHLNLGRCSELIEFPGDVSGLKNLEILILSRCSRLKHLPENIGWMNSLRELMVDGTAVEMLPESIFRLTKLERLSLANCQSLKMLPRCIGNLCSLEHLSLYGSGVELIPDSIGSLGNLETLNLQWCRSMAVIPCSVGNLKSLANLYLNGSAIQFLPESIGSLYYLRALKIGSCKDQITFPDSIKGLSSLVDLELDSTEITGLPSEIGALKSLERLEIRNCKNLCLIPNSIGNLLALKTLIITSSAINELPESLGMLENLVMMRLNQCRQLSSLPSSIGHLKNLCHLIMDHTSVSALPETFGMLSNLMVLRMGKKPFEPISHTTNTTTLPFSFSKLSVLEEFDARGWRISGKISDDFGQLSSLETLNLSHNHISGLPSSMRGLCVLKMLVISHCKLLIALPSLPSSLVELNAANCIALETIFDLSNLKNLQELNLTNCERLVDVPGIENMNSLRMLHMSGCTSCSSVIATKLHKDVVKKLYSFSIPGSEIPNWFTQGEVYFSSRRNIGIKGVIVSIIVSVNHQIPDDLRDELPVIPNIHAKILRVNEPIYTTAMHLIGVPRKPEDNLYLCKFPDCHPLVSVLEDGDIIKVGISSGLPIQGIELKKCGIHLVFENDDDYGGTEESLEENQQSVSEKLTRFIGSSSSSVVNGNHTSSSTLGGWTLLGFLQDMLCFLKKLWDGFRSPGPDLGRARCATAQGRILGPLVQPCPNS